MKRKKIFCIWGILMLVVIKMNAQVFSILRLGKVVYSTASYDADSTIKKRYSRVCSDYVSKYYEHRKLPLIYLLIAYSRIDSAEYELAYDNFKGFPRTEDNWVGNAALHKFGIRIRFYSVTYQPENLLKLLDYGINHMQELKRQSRSLRKRIEYDDDVQSLSLSSGKIHWILEQPAAPKVKAFLSQ